MKIDLDPSKKYLLACSFGPDSMALFSLLKEQRYTFEVAHVNYNMRSESLDEMTKLNEYCKDNGINFHVLQVHYVKEKINFQKWARDVRYSFFKQIIEKNDIDILLTGHQQDDLIETYLMQTASSREVGYFGIKPSIKLFGLEVRRPLLDFSKQALLDYCESHHIPFSIDKSNLVPKYTRNRIRLNIVNWLDQRERQSILEEIQQKNDLSETLSRNVNQLIDEREYVHIDDYLKLTLVARKRLVYLLFERKDFSESYTRGIFNRIDSILSSHKTSTLVSIKNNFALCVFYGQFTIIDKNQFSSYEGAITFSSLRFSNRFVDYNLEGELSKLGISKDDFPLIIRTYKKGDKYQIKDYRKPINRLFIDMKMPKHIRLIWPILTNNKGQIIYVPRYRSGYVEKEKNKLKVLL
jgi:tRNA(Ile)-lysidine synthase